MNDQSPPTRIGPAEVIAFLAHHEVHVTEVIPYAEGVASRNFRATGPGKVDLTVRCDFRRSLQKVREDRLYSGLAHDQGIAVPTGAWIDGHIGDVATTARPTIDGRSLAQLAASQLPAPGRIGEMLAALHRVAPPAGDRRFFYEGLLDVCHPMWRSFPLARAAFRQDGDIGDLVEHALARLERDVSWLRALTDIPRCMIHGDFNPPNILASGAGLILIDWEKACAGYPVADLVQAIYYFSACYGRDGQPFAAEFTRAYTRTHEIPRPVLEPWLSCFPAFIFLRDTVSATAQAADPIGRMQRARFQAYVHDDSAPRFRHFLDHERQIRDAVLS
jgi:Ser/Thr protein kinase RdoA (MazF antagonist)